MPRVFLSAGDPSGDLLAAELVSKLKEKLDGCQIYSIGGPALQNLSDFFIEDLTKKGLIGWVSPIARLPYILSLLDRIERIFQKEHIDCVIPVDFYGFNIELAKRAKKLGIPVVYFVSPQVWASRASRIKKIKQYVDMMLCLFPFEETLYKSHGVCAHFIGHPLTAKLQPREKNFKPDAQFLIGLLAGSRAYEVKRHLPILMQVWENLRQNYPKAQAYLFQCRELEKLYPKDDFLKKQGIGIIRDPYHEIRHKLDLAICASGLATVENMLLGTPMVVFYCVSPGWLYPILKRIVKTPYIAMPNILAGKKLVEEIHWGDFPWKRRQATEKITRVSLRLLSNHQERLNLRQSLLKLRNHLQAPSNQSPQELAAQYIVESVNRKTYVETAVAPS